MKTVHSILAGFLLISMVFVMINSVMSLRRNEKFKAGDRKLGLFALIFAHTQLLVGLATYYVSPWYASLKNMGMKGAMKDAVVRLLTVEHPLTMIIAIALITVGWSKHKKATTDAAKFKSFIMFYGIALVLILARIPWSQWF